MELPLISIIVPVYDVEKYLNKCIDSLLCQTYQNIEIIIVDDGSPDNCPQMCDYIAKKSNKIVVYHKENGGLGSARNFGVRKANAEWIVFVDSDDYVLPEYVQYMWNLLRRYGADIVSCGITAEDNDGNVLYKSRVFKEHCLNGKNLLYESYFGKCGHRVCSKLLERNICLNTHFRRATLKILLVCI